MIEECRNHQIAEAVVQEEMTAENYFAQIEMGKVLGIAGGGMLLKYFMKELVGLPLTDSLPQYGVVLAWRQNDDNPAISKFVKLAVK